MAYKIIATNPSIKLAWVIKSTEKKKRGSRLWTSIRTRRVSGHLNTFSIYLTAKGHIRKLNKYKINEIESNTTLLLLA